jgi:hypothetical protein
MQKARAFVIKLSEELPMLTIPDKDLTNLGNRSSFNRTLRHLVGVTSIIENIEKGQNLADQLNALLDAETILRDQVSPILSLVLVSKLDLPYRSFNIVDSVNKFDVIRGAFQKWVGLDAVIAYHHPNLGIIPINPSNEAHWNLAFELKRDELIVVYVRAVNKKRETAEKGLDAFFALLSGATPAEDPEFMTKPAAAPAAPARVAAAPAPAAGAPRPLPVAQARPMPTAPGAPPVAVQAQAPQPMPEAPAAAAPSGPAPAASRPAGAGGARNLTPKYSVQVTNELFHNGNVEAWKNIIESYETAHPGCKVIVYHEGELIQDLNSLFKWGKVKHGGLLMFQVAGSAIKNVSRLQKYLHEGASKRYEAFMKHDLNRTLSLF